MPALSRRLSRSALVGLVAWSALLFVPLAGGAAHELGAHLVLLAPLVLVPLYLDAALPASFERRTDPALAAASWLILPGALAAAGSFLVPVGMWAGALVVPWGLATAAVAVWALRGAWRRHQAGTLDAAEVVLAAGFASLPGGAVWLGFARAGIDPGPYGPLVVLLTAAHFHYGAFAAAVWSGLLGRALPAGSRLRPAWAATAAGLVVGFWLVAFGIAASGGPAGGPALETVGVALLTASAMGTGALGVALGPTLADRWAGLMVAVSGGALALAMGLAVWFHLGPRLGIASPDVLWMLPRHGWLNAVGFGLWGALGWRRLRPRPARAAAPAAPPVARAA
ncbi:YndJ family transporter [Rubrivirga sp. S365]|uniref:YndJ family transporter n=1 Tax=Rubrivirga litoralis TaxID=3075598 RepID=A0ABU3BLY8_9BACT|nr:MULTISPECIES: YndJ family transporter [unclassified Rubrivirga]MDT0630302.1 YndJ family transporter [Rubrivirga sp. F394]MDT7855814.1 YndJ family transporter [Rubrivirga sp. S365]